MSTSTPGPDPRNTAFAYPTRKSDMAAPKTIPSKEAKGLSAAEKHKRSRSGCFTCRLRRKKCDEVKPACKACKHLGLKCDYKRPSWWGDSDQRSKMKDKIKHAIKRTQVAKKATRNTTSSPGSASPPGLYHSISTPEGFQDSVMGSYSHSRAVSIDQSPLVSDHSFACLSPESYFSHLHHQHPHAIPPPHYSAFGPFEMNVKTDRQIFVNDVPTRRDSTVSSFSLFQPHVASSSDCSPLLSDDWAQQDYFEPTKGSAVDNERPQTFFNLSRDLVTPLQESMPELDEGDHHLLGFFLDKVSSLLYPVLDTMQHGKVKSGLILPALESNRTYLHCCLAASAMHMKVVEHSDSVQAENDIMRHCYSIISELCTALERDTDHEQILEATLALAFFPSRVGRPEDRLTDIPWHNHLQAAKNLVEKLELPKLLNDSSTVSAPSPSINMALTAWIDILGATMRGTSPVFADTYRELNIAKRTAGLSELMGCDDNVMFLISEIACLEARKAEGMEDVMLCKYIEILGFQISLGEPEPSPPCHAVSDQGTIRPRQLLFNMSSIFRLAARMYLCSMVPGFTIDTPNMKGLLLAFTDMMTYIPAGENGFDRSLAWPLLIAGSISTVDSPFRPMLADRCSMLEDMGTSGSLGRVQEILHGLWAVNDVASDEPALPPVHWREIMMQYGWDCLLI